MRLENRYNNAMQLYEEPSSEPKVDLPQHRVTPEELTRALAAIEARQQEAAQRQEETDRYLAETIPVDEAVRELNLPVTPEEVWAEVQAQREAADLNEATQPEDSTEKEKENISPPAFSESSRRFVPVQFSNHQKKWPRWRMITATAATAVFSFAIAFSHHHSSYPRVQGNPLASPYNASNFPDNIPFQIFPYSAIKLLSGAGPATISVSPDTSPGIGSSGSWEFIKYDGHIYMRGWIAAPKIGESLPKGILDIHNSVCRELGLRPALLTLRLDQLTFCNYYQQITTTGDNDSNLRGMDQKIVLSDVRYDQHTLEMAQAVMSTNDPFLPKTMYLPKLWEGDLTTKSKNILETYIGNANEPMISKTANNLPFEVSSDGLGYLLSGMPLTKVHVNPGRVHTTNLNDGGSWDFIKYADKLYLRGWIIPDTKMNGAFLHLYNFATAKELGRLPKHITLCFDNFKYGPFGRVYSLPFVDPTGSIPRADAAGRIYSGANYQQLLLSDVHLDSHAWEKWSP
jgi:hypothetical protein